MPRYFIETDDGQLLVKDDDGTNLPDLQAARHEAVIVLPEIARGMIGRGNSCPVTSRVRNGSGAVLFEATLTLSEHWTADPNTTA